MNLRFAFQKTKETAKGFDGYGKSGITPKTLIDPDPAGLPGPAPAQAPEAPQQSGNTFGRPIPNFPSKGVFLCAAAACPGQGDAVDMVSGLARYLPAIRRDYLFKVSALG